jgi:uncharacterized protein YjbI with pentapeptide repeats
MTDNIIQSSQEAAERIGSGRLEGCLLQDLDLSKTKLSEIFAADATFRRVGLQHAAAQEGDYSRSKFTEVSARGVRFDRSLMRGSSFFNSELIEAVFAGSNLSGTSFFSTRLGNADFQGCRLLSCTFNSCELFGVRFTRSLLVNSRFEAQERGNVTLDRADFSNAVLVDCDLQGSNLFGASFKNALLVKVDLRQANLTNGSFEGARLIDVQIDLGALEPGERRQVEQARIEDPWRAHGFMVDVLAGHSEEELCQLVEVLMRTYVIEGAQPAAATDTFPGLLASLKARYDFPELDAMRLRGTTLQVRHGHQWVDLGTPVPGIGGAPATPRPVPEPERPRPVASAQPAAALPIEEAEDTLEADNRQPKNVRRSKRFRKLEMD